MPSHVLILDTEARIEEIKLNPDDKYLSQKQTFRLGSAIRLDRHNGKWFESEPLEFYTIADFWNYLDSTFYNGIKLYVYAHNMAYDYTILALDTYISSRKMQIKSRSIDTIFMVSAERPEPEKGTIVFLSTTNYYQKSLKELGKIFGMEKSECPDFQNVSDSVLMPYCINDTKVLTHLIKQHIDFIDKYDLGNYKMTIASQAFTAFRHRFLKNKILVHTFDDILEMELESYRGGRCEAFILGKRDSVFKLDVNSMYPSMMLENNFPLMPVSKEPLINVSIDDITTSINSGLFVLADCNLKLKEPALACKREKLLFPIGKIRQTITSPEFEYILNNPDVGEIEKINNVVGYTQDKIFSDYVKFFYNIRINAENPAIECMAKLFLNSLYGKFGQKAYPNSELVTNDLEKKILFDAMALCKTSIIDDIEDKSRKFIKLGDALYCIEKDSEILARESIPIIASAVTSYSRIYLFQLMKLAGLDNVFYCDTDSLFVNESGYDNLLSANKIDSTQLGKMKLEEKGSVEIFGAKNYKFNESTKLKGIKHNAEQLPNGDFKQYHFNTKNNRYRKGFDDGTVILEPVVKHISKNYDKGIVDNLGIIHPLRFSEW